MKALALDFDGVISDSARESFAVARQAYLELCPDSPLRDRDHGELFALFLTMMPLGNRADDYGSVLTALARGRELQDQEAYDAFHAAQDPDWLKRFHRQYYEVRLRLSTEDPRGWRALMRPYDGLVEILRRRAGPVSYAIATSKDRRSVDLLLEHYGIADLFQPELIMDKETGPRKAVHLQQIGRLPGLEPAEMTFVDDKVNHLDKVSPLGVRCALAAWGYNGQREHELARARGYLVCRIEDVESRLFGQA